MKQFAVAADVLEWLGGPRGRIMARLQMCIIALALLPTEATASTPQQSTPLQVAWTSLPRVPDREGFAGPFAGVCSGALVVAGGANFPNKKPWEGGVKKWYASVFVLEPPGIAWRIAGKLPRPLAYGLSISSSSGILCAGGAGPWRHYADVFLLKLVDGKVRHRKLPAMPVRCAYMSGGLVGSVLYVAGGTSSPDATQALHTFWSLDLAAERPRWRVLEPWPGPARMLAVAATHDGAFFLFSGADLQPDTAGKPVRTYLRDAYRYVPGSGWNALSSMPRAAVAAPSPAPFLGSHIVVISGDDGTLTSFEPKSQHPGFPRNLIGFDPRTKAWADLGSGPLSRATAPVVEWGKGFVILNGETRPGVRSPEVWALTGR